MFPRAVRNASLVVVVCCLCLLQCEAWQAGLRRWRRQTSGQDLGPKEEGTRISRTCDYNTAAGGAPLVWEVQLATVKRTAASCVTLQVPYSCTVPSGFSSLFTVTTDQTQATLTWNADRRFLSLSCTQSAGSITPGQTEPIANWTLVTYLKPTDLACRSPEFTNNNNTVSVTCVSSVIFPKDPRCVLYKQTGGGSRVQMSLPPSYGTDTAGSVSGPSCTFTLQASELGAGTHSLSVNMYPQFDGSGENYGVNRVVSPDVTFYYPEPEFVNCSSGAKVSGDYIMSGSKATCKCRQKTEGFPAGTVVLSQGGSTLGSGAVASGNVNNPGNNNNDQTLTCRSESSLGQAGPSVSKTVKFAYGPSSATLTFSRTNPFSLCQGPNLTLVSACTVDPRTVNPQPDYKISVNGTQVGTSVQQTLQLQGGAQNVRCRVENSLFPADLFTEVTETFIVLVPPPDPPEITVSQPSVLSTGEILVKENVTTRVQCVVRGGYPATSNVSLSCTSSQAGSSDGSSVVVTRSQGTQCSCTATHDSGCYDKRSNVTVKAAYGPEGVTLERKNVRPEETGTYNLCPSATPDITMECSVGVVYPAASLTLTVTPTGTQTVDACTGNDNKCSYFVPTSGGNHEFRCGAVNSAFGDIRGASPPVQVYVREPPKDAPKLSLKDTDFSGSTADNSVVFVDGQENSVECHVDGGSPKVSPSDIYVQCDGVNVTDGTVVFTRDRNATNCTCRAQHPSGCYDLSTEVLVIVRLQNETMTEGEPSSVIGPAVGGAVGAFVVLALIVLAVYCVCRRRDCLGKCKEDKTVLYREGKEEDEQRVVVDNSALYGNSSDLKGVGTTRPTSDCVVVDNSALYGKSSDLKGVGVTRPPSDCVVVDNSALYGKSSDLKGVGVTRPPSDCVVVDNSALYGKSSDLKAPQKIKAKDYRQVQTNVTSATAPPKNYSNHTLPMDNPYEDIPDPSDPKKTGPAPSAPPKPSVAAKPKVKAASQSHYNNVEIVRQAGAGGSGGGSVVAVVPEDTYSTVSKVKSAVTPPAAQTADTDVDFPDQTRSPVVPDKHFAADDPENNNNVLAETGKAGVRAAGGAVTSEQVYNNTAYSPQDLEEDATYVNAANCSAGDNNSDKDKRASNGYYHNPDGLLYMTLASAGSAQGQGASSKSPVRHARKEEPVEYTSLKFTAQPR